MIRLENIVHMKFPKNEQGEEVMLWPATISTSFVVEEPNSMNLWGGRIVVRKPDYEITENDLKKIVAEELIEILKKEIGKIE